MKTLCDAMKQMDLFKPNGNCTWCNVSGRRVVLRPISILQLSEAERLALQKIVLQKIQSCDLGCPVLIPKEPRESGRRKKHLLSIKRSKSANLTGIIHGLVLQMTMTFNENETQGRSKSGRNLTSSCIARGTGNQRNASSDSLSESESSRNTNSSLTDALSHTRHGSLGQSSVPLYATGPPQVPHIVKACFQHIETYGLRVLGIFRVGCSKKKTNQLRDEFDSGVEVKLNESHNPHEVGAVLKEYFRDLPEPLLTRDLYSPLIAAKGLPNLERQLEITRMLVSLLPVPSRDTLWALLQFLNNVEKHSTDAVDERGETAKQTEKEFAVESIERAEERKDVIAIPASLHDDVLRLLLETDPETTEQILKRISAENGIEVDPDTSSSYYDDSDASLPHSPISESNMQFRSTGNLSAMPLRVARSAEILTPTARRKFFYNDGRPDNSDNNGSIRRKSEVNNALEERPKFHLVIENSPSPPEVQKNPRVSRTERQGMTRDNSSPELYRRPHSMHLERPHSELYCTPKTLSIPTPDYARTNSDPYKSTSNSRSDSLTPERVTSSRAVSTSPRVTSSIQRPLNFNRATPEGENEWQKNRWRQWDNMTSHSPGDGNFEQETLV
ncbi:RHG06-like protein [Mya arenaria]|uniref:RHG06-like protein n=1 Tax=Mya arenaria TaxID=6604 RepID=A0ABY7DNL5_MYAAR|nr:RHG06-like protein [Mya arenaria]